MASDILTFLSHPIFALFFACVICALQISGAITVKLARLFLFVAWLVAVIGTSTMLNNAPLQHRAIVGGLVGIPAALLLFFVERLITKTVKKREGKTPPLLTNIELKRQANNFLMIYCFMLQIWRLTTLCMTSTLEATEKQRIRIRLLLLNAPMKNGRNV